MQDMNQEGRERMRRAEETMAAAAAERELRRRLEAAKTPKEREPIKRAAFDCQGLHPANAGRFADVVADINRLNGTAPATGADVAKLGEKLEQVEQQGVDIVAEARRLKEGKRVAEEKRMAEALGALDMLVDGLEPDHRSLFLELKKADGIRTAAAKRLGISQETVSKRLPALRKAIEDMGKEIPLFLLPRKGGRKGTPDKTFQETYRGGEIIDSRTPFDEVAEKEESEHGPV